jgi:hypothetical protein
LAREARRGEEGQKMDDRISEINSDAQIPGVPGSEHNGTGGTNLGGTGISNQPGPEDLLPEFRRKKKSGYDIFPVDVIESL